MQIKWSFADGGMCLYLPCTKNIRRIIPLYILNHTILEILCVRDWWLIENENLHFELPKNEENEPPVAVGRVWTYALIEE